MRPPIIDRADLQTLQHRTVSAVLTVVFWTLWTYLWLPLLALVAWLLGIQQAYKYMIKLDGYREVLHLLGLYTLVVGMLGGSLVAWAGYNIWRWGGTKNRSGGRVPSVEQVARYFRQGPIAVGSWRNAQRLYVVNDEQGGILRVDILEPGEAVPEEGGLPVESKALVGCPQGRQAEDEVSMA